MATVSLPLEKTFTDARKLLARLQENEAFRQYLRRRLQLVIPPLVLFLLISIACAAATVIFLADRHRLLALPGLLLAPFVLAGSLFVQLYLFLSWLENRAVARALGLASGKPPPVPWGLAAIFLALPLAFLVAVAGKPGLVLLVLAVLAPIAYARFDR
jgi:hypothetical protein